MQSKRRLQQSNWHWCIFLNFRKSQRTLDKTSWVVGMMWSSWWGHVRRMSDHRSPKQLLYGAVNEGKRSCGGQKKNLKDFLWTVVKKFNIDFKHMFVLFGVSAYRAVLIHIWEVRKKDEKGRESQESRTTAATGSLHFCHLCGRNFWSQISLISHLCTHHNTKAEMERHYSRTTYEWQNMT